MAICAYWSCSFSGSPSQRELPLFGSAHRHSQTTLCSHGVRAVSAVSFGGGELVFGLGASIFGVMFVGIACAGAYAMTRRVNPAQEDRPSPQGPYASSVRGTPCSDLRAHTSFHEDSVRLCDKQFAIIGSANTNQRGWTHDSEICAGIYDESTNDHASYSFAHRLRVALWAEHLNMNTADGHAQLADGVASAANWLLPGSNVDVFAENVGQDSEFRQLAPLLFVDPDGS